MLLYRTTALAASAIATDRGAMWFVWPVRDFWRARTAARIFRIRGPEEDGEQRTEEGIEALVEAAEEEGYHRAGNRRNLIEQVVEFSDKRRCVK